MNIETLSALPMSAKGMMDPIQKVNKQAVSTFEKLATQQLDSLGVYLALGINQLKAAVKVKDMDSLRDFISKQRDAINAVAKRLSGDADASIKVGAEFVAALQGTGIEAVKTTTEKTAAA